MMKKLEVEQICTIFAILFFVFGLFINGTAAFFCMLCTWCICGYRVAFRAVRGLVNRQLLDENFLMTVASVGAFFLGDYLEGAAVMLFFRIGEQFEDYAVNRSRKSVAALMELRPDKAVLLLDQQEVEVDPEDVAVGDILLVKPGDRVPVDGVVIHGSAALDSSQITGESEPKEVIEGDSVISGCVNLSGVLQVRAESSYEHSTVGRIMDLVESASDKKAKTERMITRFAQIYTPAVVISAVLLAVVPPIVFAQPFSEWVRRALTFLVISCPCALVISVPLSFFGGMGAASRQGIVIKGGIVLEKLAALDQLVFDKTGTLTTGEFSVSGVFPETCSKNELIRLVATAEQYSSHPVARAICSEVDTFANAEQIEELPGYGISALVDGMHIQAGNRRLLSRNGIEAPEASGSVTCIYVILNGCYAGRIELEDCIRSFTKDVLQELRTLGIRQTAMMTGDVAGAADNVACKLNLDAWYAELLPQDKVLKMEEIMKTGRTTAFVGDGVNDAPVLSIADVGIAMGGVGTEAAVEAADVVILNDNLGAICTMKRIAVKTKRIAVQNIAFALGIKLLVLILGAFGFANMWMAVFADVGVSVIAILNAMRTMYSRK